MQNIVMAEDARHLNNNGWPRMAPDSSVELLLQGDDPYINLQDLAPEPYHVLRLWQLFLDRVNPLTKIIHVPSLLPCIAEAAVNLSGVSLDHQAILFGVYTLATSSLSEGECTTLFNHSRQAALQKYSLGARLALTRINFLKRYNMTIFQALLLFLVRHSLGPELRL